jgi:DNA polymerase-1
MQGNGSEMLRLGCALMTEQGIRVCAPVHDAVLIEAPIGELEHTVERAREAMAEASSVVLAGFELRTDTKIVRHPERYADPRGEGMWRTILSLVAELPGSCGSNV